MVKVSVLIPTYNQGDYLKEALDSVMAQSFKDFEVIILDNCSTDNTAKIAALFLNDKRFKYYKNEVNIGNINNFNRIIGYASGEYIKYLFSDDLLHPNALKEFVKVLDNSPDVSIATSFFEYFGTYSSLEKQPLIGRISGYEAIKRTVTSTNWIGAPSNVIFRKSVLHDEKFQDKWRWYADLELWHKLLTKGDLYVIPQNLTKFRQHIESASTTCMINYENFYDEYYYLKHIKDKNLYSPLKDEPEFKLVLKRNAIRWVSLIPRFYKEKKYSYLKKAFKAIIEENLAKKVLRKVLEKFIKIKSIL